MNATNNSFAVILASIILKKGIFQNAKKKTIFKFI